MYAYFYHGSARSREDDDGLIPYQNTSQSARAKFTSDLPFTPAYVQKNLAGVPDPATTYNERVKKKQLHLENPAALSRIKKQRDAKRAEKQELKAKKRLGVMNRKEAAEKGLWKLKKEETKYDLFVPLHHMWLGYMSELLGLSTCPASSVANASAMPSSAGMHTKLVKADFHGSIMTVRRSKNSALVGLSGIVIHETENAFRVVTQKNKMKLIPKHNSVFAFAVPLYSTLQSTSDASNPVEPLSTCAPGDPSQSSDQPTWTVLDRPHIEFELYGNQFQFRSAERAGKKFKAKETIEL